jgi:hypothetical protein
MNMIVYLPQFASRQLFEERDIFQAILLILMDDPWSEIGEINLAIKSIRFWKKGEIEIKQERILIFIYSHVAYYFIQPILSAALLG